MIKENEVFDFIDQQKEKWPTYAANLKQLEAVETKEFNFGSYSIIAQHNPARIVSTGANVDSKSIASRKCFLCKENRPAEQLKLDIGTKYTLLVNPFPILKNHLTIASTSHCEQSIYNNIEDILSSTMALNVVLLPPTTCTFRLLPKTSFLSKNSLPCKKALSFLTIATEKSA